MMKIAFVVHDYHRVGGHGRYVVELAERFSKSHDVHVYSNTYRAERDSSVQFHHVRAWRGTAQLTILTFLASAALRLDKSFDIVHAQGLSSLRADVVTAHICIQAWLKAQRRYGIGRAWKTSMFERLICPLEKRLYQAPGNSSVIAVSEKTKRELGECYGRRARVRVIHHGVDGEHFRARERSTLRAEVRAGLGLAESDIMVLYVGDLHKGAVFALNAMRSVRNGKLVFVTGTPTRPYRRLSRQLNDPERILFCPPTNDIRRFYAAADVFLFPSVYDAFGMVISEAMAAGLPIVTTRQAGASELVSHGEDGLVLDDPAEVGQMAEYLRGLGEDAMLRQRLGRAAQEKMRAHSWERVARETMSAYEEAATARGHLG